MDGRVGLGELGGGWDALGSHGRHRWAAQRHPGHAPPLLSQVTTGENRLGTEIKTSTSCQTCPAVCCRCNRRAQVVASKPRVETAPESHVYQREPPEGSIKFCLSRKAQNPSKWAHFHSSTSLISALTRNQGAARHLHLLLIWVKRAGLSSDILLTSQFFHIIWTLFSDLLAWKDTCCQTTLTWDWDELIHFIWLTAVWNKLIN